MDVVFSFVLCMKYEPMFDMFKILEASGLKTFLGCTDNISKPLLDELFNTVSMEHGEICRVQV